MDSHAIEIVETTKRSSLTLHDAIQNDAINNDDIEIVELASDDTEIGPVTIDIEPIVSNSTFLWRNKWKKMFQKSFVLAIVVSLLLTIAWILVDIL